jgi:hypothetical protein
VVSLVEAAARAALNLACCVRLEVGVAVVDARVRHRRSRTARRARLSLDRARCLAVPVCRGVVAAAGRAPAPAVSQCPGRRGPQAPAA